RRHRLGAQARDPDPGVLRSDRVAATGPRRSPAASWQPIVHGIARPSVRPRGDFRIGGGRSNVPGGTAGLQTRLTSKAPERFPSSGDLSNRPKASSFGSFVGLPWGWPIATSIRPNELFY